MSPSDRRPTPIRISVRVRHLIILVIMAMLLLIVWAVPIVLVISLGGFAIALVLSFPVHLLSRVMPRELAILLAFLILLAVLFLVFYGFVPLLLAQVGALVNALPGLMRNLEQYLLEILDALHRHNLLPTSPEAIVTRLGEDLKTSFGAIARNALSGTVGLVYGAFGFALTLFAIIFVGASLLANVRTFKAAYLRSVPFRYRHDALELWNALDSVLLRYLGGLAIVLLIQGALSAAALYVIGIPYALALGAWVSITAVIPYLGAWLGAIPALLVASSISPTAVVLTAVVFLVIQQLEGNVLTPRIQGQTIRVPSVIIFLAVIVGGGLAGLVGVLFAVPMLAVLRTICDFFRVRLRTN